MQFLYPGFLWALLALAIPVIIHLFSFRKYRTIYFSNVAFLREVQEESSARNRLRHLLVLIARMLALAFLVFAFAQPILPQQDDNVRQGARTVSVYIDNSFSMDASGAEVDLLQQAKEMAIALADGYQETDRFQLLTNDFEGRHQRLTDREQFKALVAEVAVSPAVRTLEQVEERMEQATQGEEQPDFYFLSDFQASTANLEPDTGHQIYLLPLSARGQANLSIDSVWSAAPVQMVQQPATLMVKITNHGNQPVEDGTLSLVVNGERKAVGSFSLEAESSVVDTLTFTVTAAGWNGATVSVTDYPITFDDEYSVSFFAPDVLKVMAIQDEQSPYMQALQNQEVLEVQTTRSTQVDYSRMDEYRLVILNQLNGLSSGLVSALTAYVEQGGNLLVYPGTNADLAAYESLLRPLTGAALLPLQEKAQQVQSLSLEDRFFAEVFTSWPENVQLPGVKRMYPIDRPARSRLMALLTLQDGSTYLGKAVYGNGSVVVCGAPLQSDYSDLPRHALFAIIAVQAALEGNSRQPLSFVLGQDEAITITEQLLQDQPVHLRAQRADAGVDFIPPQQPVGRNTIIRFSGTLDMMPTPGLYELYKPGNTDVLSLLAFNYDRTESALQYLSSEDLQTLYPGANVQVIEGDDASLSIQAGINSRGISLWKLCVILALSFLAAEVLLLRLLPAR